MVSETMSYNLNQGKFPCSWFKGFEKFCSINKSRLQNGYFLMEFACLDPVVVRYTRQWFRRRLPHAIDNALRGERVAIYVL